MTRKEFIDRIIAIYRLKYKPSDLEVDEFRLALELMPDSPIITTPSQSPVLIPTDDKTNPWWRDTVVMYGCPIPDSVTYNNAHSSSSLSDFINKEDKNKQQIKD